MADTTLRQAFSDIANAIRAKGVTGTMTPLQMPTKVASISSSKYGVSVDSVLGNVDQNGVLQPPSTSFQFSSNDIVSIPSYGLYCKFYNTAVTSVSLPYLTTVGQYGMQHSFDGCTSLTTVDLSSLASVGQYGLDSAFKNCSALTSIDLSNVTTASGNYAMQYAFRGCTSMTSADISSLSSIGTGGMDSTFKGCTSLETVYLSSLSTVGTNGLNNTMDGCVALEVVDFSEATAVPSITSTTFSNTNSTFQIVVPDSLYSTWIAATNWSALSSQIVKASEYTPAS